jgi:hypothetical protein
MFILIDFRLDYFNRFSLFLKSICKINFAWKSILKIDNQNRLTSKVDFTNQF